MARATAKKVLMGYGLWIKREGAPKYHRVGGLYNSRYEASVYFDRNYSSSEKYRIEAIRLTAQPIAPREVSKS